MLVFGINRRLGLETIILLRGVCVAGAESCCTAVREETGYRRRASTAFSGKCCVTSAEGAARQIWLA